MSHNFIQITTTYLHSAETGLQKAGSWLGKRVADLTKKVHKVGEKLTPSADKTAATFSTIIKSSYFSAGLILTGIALTVLYGNKLAALSQENLVDDDAYVSPIGGVIVGITLLTLGVALLALPYFAKK